MPAKPTLRIDLGELDTYFERGAVAKGKSVNSILGEALQQLLSGSAQVSEPSRKRSLRSVTFASVEEQASSAMQSQIFRGRSRR